MDTNYLYELDKGHWFGGYNYEFEPEIYKRKRLDFIL